MSGIELIAEGRGLRTFVVQNVRYNSPADRAGVRKGDILKKVNGINTQNLDLSRINALFRSKEGKKIRLKVERNGQVLKSTFHLHRLL